MTHSVSDERRGLAAGEHEVAERDLLVEESEVADPLVDPLVAPADEQSTRGRTASAAARAWSRRRRPGVIRTVQARGAARVPPRLDRRGHDRRHHHHARAAAVGLVVHLAVPVRGETRGCP